MNLNTISNDIKSQLTTIKTHISNGDRDKAENSALKLEENWKEYEDKLSFFISSDDINELGLEISNLAPIIKNEREKVSGEIRKIEVMLKHLNSEDKYRIN